ncbi:hypothetical protein NHX12_003468 [Muraenolepis orangiensis]|uniref:Uncharacterized protein n=1 Tax=Muraenolepis orangiensis TaxID=630683 RepID=A0A9Q0DZ90_9TELE|nr:hypothetical protein NHX12_003468 [Muraenolepis orangiensis]
MVLTPGRPGRPGGHVCSLLSPVSGPHRGDSGVASVPRRGTHDFLPATENYQNISWKKEATLDSVPSSRGETAGCQVET